MTAPINLLPWRQRRRDRQRRVFLAGVGIAATLSALVVLVAGIMLDGQAARQDHQNRVLTESIAELDGRIDEIDSLRRGRDATMAKLAALVRLKGEGDGAVRLFNELATTLPPGIHYTALARRGALLEVRGLAQSNGDVSALMRELEASPAFDIPILRGIEDVGPGTDGDSWAAFQLSVALSTAQPI